MRSQNISPVAKRVVLSRTTKSKSSGGVVMRSRIRRICFNDFSSISMGIASSSYEAQDVGRTTYVPEESFFTTSSLALLAAQIPSLSSSVSGSSSLAGANRSRINIGSGRFQRFDSLRKWKSCCKFLACSLRLRISVLRPFSVFVSFCFQDKLFLNSSARELDGHILGIYIPKVKGRFL
jgi:hypothetical protein